MLLLDDGRRIDSVNGALLQLLGHRKRELVGRRIWEFVQGGPLLSTKEFERLLAQGHYSSTAELRCADGRLAKVRFAAHTEVITGRRLVLCVVLSTTRAGRQQHAPAVATSGEPLSERECQVVTMLAEGANGPEIAEELQVSEHTVRTHLRNARQKMGARSQAHLVAKALAEGVILPGGAGEQRSLATQT